MISKLTENLKNIVIICFVVIVGILGYNYYNSTQENKRLNSELIGQVEKYEQLSKNTAKLETYYKSQQELIKAKEEEWKELLGKEKNRIKMLTNTIFTLQKSVTTTNKSDAEIDGYYFNELNLSGKDSPPIGYIMIKKDGSKVEKANYSFNIEIKNIQTLDEKTGKIKVYSKAFIIMNGDDDSSSENLNKWKGKQYPLPVTGGTVIVDPTVPNQLTPKLFMWNPRIGLSASIGVDSNGLRLLPGLGVSFMSYGMTEADSKFKFLNIGFNAGKVVEDWDFHFKPVLYRPLDILSNTFIFPAIGYSKGGLRWLLGVELEF